MPSSRPAKMRLKRMGCTPLATDATMATAYSATSVVVAKRKRRRNGTARGDGGGDVAVPPVPSPVPAAAAASAWGSGGAAPDATATFAAAGAAFPADCCVVAMAARSHVSGKRGAAHSASRRVGGG